MQAIEAYRRIRRAAAEAGFGWVTEQVEQEILQGKTMAKLPDSDEPREIKELTAADVRKQKRPVLTTVAYSDNEKVRLLASALRRVVHDTTTTRDEVSRFFMAEDVADGHISSVIFVEETLDETREVRIELAESSLETRRKVERLDRLLKTSMETDWE